VTAPRTVKIPDHVLTRPVDGELVLLNLDNEQYYGLDAVGTAFWNALEQLSDVEAAKALLLEQYEVDADILSADLDALLIELDTRGLVILVPK
jgi:hypothetical protein